MPDIQLGDVPAHLAVPPVGGPWPGVVVLHEAFGLNDDIREQAARLAAAGYLAVAPDLSAAAAAPLPARHVQGAAGRAGQPFDDIERSPHARRARGLHGPRRRDRLLHGRRLRAAHAARGFDASAPNYSPLPKDLDADCTARARSSRATASAIELRGAAAEGGGGFGARGVEHDVKEYPDAGHSFFNRHNTGPLRVLEGHRGRYHQPSAEDAWARILRFFETHLGTGERQSGEGVVDRS